jgi:hypothetical protein
MRSEIQEGDREEGEEDAKYRRGWERAKTGGWL